MKTVKVWIEIISLALIVIGALNWGLIGVFGFNLVSWIAEHTFDLLEPLVYTLVGIAAIVHLFSRDYYLPFLGQCAYPCGSLTPKYPADADVSIKVVVEPNVNVIYWAAEPGAKVVDNPWQAYSEYENTGVARSNEKGEAILRVRTPAAYKVPRALFSKTLKPHVHYRTCTMSGMLSRIETAYV
jgi:uncharacterized membrane protein YuzA (DUF378 family)